MTYLVTSTYNPVKNKVEIQSLLLSTTVPSAEPGTVVILSKELPSFKNSLLNVNEGKITKSDISFGHYKAGYIIDISKHRIEFQCELCTSNPVHKLIAKISLTCSIKNPLAVIENNINDVSLHISQYFIPEMEAISQSYDIDQWLTVRQKINEDKYSIVSQIEELNIENINCNIELNETSKKHLEEIDRIKLESERVKIQMDEFERLTNNNETNIILLDYFNGTDKGKKIIETITMIKNDKWNNEIAKCKDVLNILTKSVESGAADPSGVKALTNILIKNVINSIETPKEKTQPDDASISGDRLITEDIKNRLSKYENKTFLGDNHSNKDNDKSE